METGLRSTNWNMMSSTAIGFLALTLTIVVLTDKKVPLISGDRGAFIGLAAIGFLMCTIGMKLLIEQLGWTHWVNIIGSVLGILAVLLILGILTGRSLPLISSDRATFVLLALIIASKWALAVFGRWSMATLS